MMSIYKLFIKRIISVVILIGTLISLGAVAQVPDTGIRVISVRPNADDFQMLLEITHTPKSADLETLARRLYQGLVAKGAPVKRVVLLDTSTGQVLGTLDGHSQLYR